MRPRLALASLVTLLIVGGAWSAAWLYVAHRAETAITAWIDGEAKSGRTYGCGSRNVAGYPLGVEIRCADPTATVDADGSRLVVSARELRAVFGIIEPDVLTINLTGPVSITDPARSAGLYGNLSLAEVTLHG